MSRSSFPVLALLLVAACGRSSLQLEGTRWLATQLGGAELSGPAQPTLEFTSAERVAGNGGCNRYSGAMRLDGSSLEFGDLASTKMACAEAASMEQERLLFAAFAATRGVRREGTELVLIDAVGQALARLRPQ